MYGLAKKLGPQTLIFHQLPTLLVSLAIAEFSYKFGSFSLEALAFLSTWFLLDYGLSRIKRSD